MNLFTLDRIGVIVFAEKVFTLLPLTTDTKIISKILEEGGYKVNFLKPVGEYSKFIVTWEVEDEE